MCPTHNSAGANKRMPARKLAQKASGLLKGLRSKQSLRRHGKGRDKHAAKKVVPHVPSEHDPEHPRIRHVTNDTHGFVHFSADPHEPDDSIIAERDATV